MKEKSALTRLEGVLVVLVILLAAVAAYGFSAAPGAVSTTTATFTSTLVSTTTLTGVQPSQLAQLKIGLILPIEPSDNSWNYQAAYSLQQLQKLYGFKLDITTNKFDGTAAEPVAVNYAQQGYNIVFLQGIQYQVMASKIAPQFPNTLFVCVDCFASNASNVYRIWLDLGEGGFILGAMAGKLTKSNTLGLIGGGRVPSIWAGHEGFKAGALYTNPSVKFSEKYEAFSWADVQGAQKDATLMIQNGADVVFSSGDGIDVGVVQAALASPTHVWVTNVYSNLSAVRPDVRPVLLGSIVVDWGVLYGAAIRDYVLGTWRWGFFTANMESGVVKVQPGPNVPADVKSLANKLQNMIITGSIIMSFDVNPQTGSPLCFDQPTLPQCADTSLNNTAAKFNYLPPLS